MFVDLMLRNIAFWGFIPHMYLGFKNQGFGRSTKGILNMLSNLFFGLSTMLFLENAKIRHFVQLWTILLLQSDVIFIKIDTKQPVNRQVGHIFYS